MISIICISDLCHKREYLNFSDDNELKPVSLLKFYNANGKSNQRLILRRLQLQIDVYSVSYMLRELKQFTKYCELFRKNPAFEDIQLLWIQITPPVKEKIDFKWNHMLSYSIWERIEVEYLMSWLSTLGGGFSALGEQFSNCAETAGKISLKQLAIGLRLGDPFLQARCKLYYSLSLIQTGRLRHAKYLVRQQYQFARKQKEVDARLLKMCLGIWLRIQYEYELRIKERERLRNMLGAGDAIIQNPTS